MTDHAPGRPRERLRTLAAARARAYRERQRAGLKSAWIAYDEALARRVLGDVDKDELDHRLEEFLDDSLLQRDTDARAVGILDDG